MSQVLLFTGHPIPVYMQETIITVYPSIDSCTIKYETTMCGYTITYLIILLLKDSLIFVVITNTSVKKYCTCIFLYSASIFVRSFPRSGITGPKRSIFWILITICLHGSCTSLHFYQQCMWMLLTTYLQNILIISNFRFKKSILVML